ncbi:unnamed protein product [Bursaphelenchus xylophilus]|uniref:(pine wood nematode) hypothetical protein n=1 Tax=Bursaphelenchus xylophilus TaxID=6326 RepID=A0A1I7RHF0_BURXY|nr:unnamed protein product [Bursaphelenchus xylophilus]CAG9115801.1 unnamed protein product [Bursaphelenchus xylophilus]
MSKLIYGLLCLQMLNVGVAWSLFKHKSEPPPMELHCFRGSKMAFSDAREESVKCDSILGIEQYCYRFTAYSPVHEMIKLGCATLLCAPFRNTCADFELSGAAGKLCCCNHGSYCNSSTTSTLSFTLIMSLVIGLLYR